MVIGLKIGTVVLVDYDSEWESIATKTIEKLYNIFGATAKDIQHIGSTAIKGVKAKPIIDIAICVTSFDDLTDVFPNLEEIGVYKSLNQPLTGIVLCSIKKERQSNALMNVHIVEIDSVQWNNHINFRDYLNKFPKKAAEYEALKIGLVEQFPDNRDAYTNGKKKFIEECLFEAHIIKKIQQNHIITTFEFINKGWSNDKKYYIETSEDKHMLLRVSDISEIDRKKAEYNMMERVYQLGVITPQPLGFGILEGVNYCYYLSSWLDGEDAETVLPLVSDTEQYVLGLKAGEMLQKIHNLPAPENAQEWGERFRYKMQARVDFYNANPIKSAFGDIIIRFLKENQNILDNRVQTFNHGDFNITNLIIMHDGQVGLIDFNYFNSDYGDPWWEFDSIPWGTEPSAHFYTGLIKGYFNGQPPSDFFKVFSYYLAYDALAALCDTSIGEQGLPEDGRRHMENILRWFDYMNNPVPTWYLINYVPNAPLTLLFGTSNIGKMNAMRKHLAGLNLNIIGLNDINIKLPNIYECGNNPLDNAKVKAQAYHMATGMPVFSCDSGLYIREAPDELQPGVHIRNICGKYLDDDEMIEYYGKLAERFGGQMTVRYKNGICLVKSETEIYEYIGDDIAGEEFIITSKPHPHRTKGFPLDSLSVHINTGKYYFDMDELKDRSSMDEGFRNFFIRVLGL